MDEGGDFDYNGLDGVAFDEEEAGSPEQGPEEPQTGEVYLECDCEEFLRSRYYLPVRPCGRF